MLVTKPQVEQILKTLPIGYYCGKNVPVKLTDENGSYYNQITDEIFISFPMIENVAKSLPKDDIIENDIRCLLYHELSHAFITNKHLDVDDIVNIFEDERIETILKHYYKNVNFKQFVKRVNNFNNEQPTSVFNLYYQIVRYRIGPQQFVDRVAKLIEQYKHTKDACGYFYTHDIHRLYDDIRNYFNENISSQLSNKLINNSSKNADENLEQSENTNKNLEQAENVNKDLEQSESQQTLNSVNDTKESDFKDENEFNDYINECEQLISENTCIYEDNDLTEQINKILSNIKSNEKTNGSAINAYSGVFNARSVIRDDYKYFVQQNRNGHVKQFSKVHLNLFIDCSGSFSNNDITVNKLLKALTKFEKANQNFEFDLISCSRGQKIRSKSDRCQKLSGGTLIKDTIFEQYRKMQLPNYKNINIVLYDGDACEGAYNIQEYRACSKNFAAFNNSNCTVIVDYENDKHVKHCKNAKVILTDRYVSELKKNVLIALQSIAR